MQLPTSEVFNDFEPGELVGARPYEMEWAGREEPRRPTVLFDDLEGWRMEVQGGATATLRPSQSQNIWNRPVGKLTYRGNGLATSSPRMLIMPPYPVPMPEGSSHVEMWIYGNRWGWENPPDTPPVRLLLHLTDSEGQTQRVLVDEICWKEWWLLHRKLPSLAKGLRLTALEVEGGWQPEDRTLFIDSITFLVESLPPLQFAPRPERNLTLFEGQLPGVNTGPGRLEFPTREETILPVNLERTFQAEVIQNGSLFLFRYNDTDCELTYQFEPTEGLSGINASLNSAPIGRPMAGGGIKFVDEGSEGKLVQAQLRDGVVTVTYERGVTYRVRLWQKSLVIDAMRRNEPSGPGLEAMEFSFGEIRGVKEPRIVYVPFITYGASNPVVLMGKTSVDATVFISIWLDWYRSGGSEPYAFSNGEFTPTGVRVNGGIRYNPRTDGRRNDVFERVFVTVSPMFEEVLPEIPNPVGVNAPLAVDRLWQESWGPADYQQEIERSMRLRAYGITKLIQCNHEITWRDGGESFTLRTRASPSKGGDEALQKYLEHQKSLGWLAGLYTNYCDYAPVNGYWNPDYVQRVSDGDWRPGWPRCWALKPVAAVELEEQLAALIKEKFHPGGRQVSAYTDVHTAVAPWQYCDYDARVPGAGTFAQTFYCYGELLRRDSHIYDGPVFSEGTFQWLYAGLADGNYGLTYNGRPIAREPLLPVFFLREIHTRECDIGMGWTDYFLQGVRDWQEDIDLAIDRFLLHTISYGSVGWLVEERFGIERVCRSYYMLQRLQSRYGLVPPEEIAYWDGERLINVSDALARELPTRRRQLFIAYSNGLEIWINDWPGGTGDAESVWSIRMDDGAYEIPPAGWLAVQNESFLTFSATVDGHKIDFLKDALGLDDEEPILYVDARGKLTQLGEVATSGALALRRISASQLEVIDIAPKKEFGLQHPLGLEGIPAKCEVFDIEGKPLGETEIRRDIDYTWITAIPNGHRYLVTFDNSP